VLFIIIDVCVIIDTYSIHSIITVAGSNAFLNTENGGYNSGVTGYCSGCVPAIIIIVFHSSYYCGSMCLIIIWYVYCVYWLIVASHSPPTLPVRWFDCLLPGIDCHLGTHTLPTRCSTLLITCVTMMPVTLFIRWLPLLRCTRLTFIVRWCVVPLLIWFYLMAHYYCGW